MTEDRDTLSEAEALRLWQKAAQLQAEAARRAEALAAGDAGTGTDVARRDEDGYALDHVRAAALEAGIGKEFVDAALAEVRAERALEPASGPKAYRISRLILGGPPDTVTARRTVHADPGTILAEMEALFPNEPYTLLLRNRLGDPKKGGTLVFDIQGVGFATAGNTGFKGDVAYADLREVHVTLVPMPGTPVRTEVTVRSPVTWALRINASISTLATALGGAIGLGVGVAVGSALMSFGPVVPVLLAAVGAGGGGTASLGGLRAIYRYGLRRGGKALEGLLSNLAARAEGGWGIAPPED